MAFLGFDLGTSGLRALLMDGEGRVLGTATHGYPSHHPHPGWSEQDPADWRAALERTVAELRAAHPEFADLKGIAVAGQMHGAVVLDADHNVLTPAILWNDTRSHEQAAALDALPQMRARSGNIVFPGFTAPKLLWLRQHQLQIFARIAHVLLPASYLNWVLTGALVADMSDAAGTSWLDVGARAWSGDLIAAGGMRRAQLPDLREGCAPAGALRPELARAWGLRGPVVVAAGAGDNAAAACGIGVCEEGQGFVSLGTSGVLCVARDSYRPAPDTALHSFCHALPKCWLHMGVMLSATASLNWLAGISGRDPATLAAALGPDLRPPGPELFLPYLAGERTPHNDAEIGGAFIGLRTQSALPDLTRAVLEGVAFGLRDSAEAMRAAGGDLERLHAVGGGARSRYWLRLIATVLGVPLQIAQGAEHGAALGAARLAQIAATGADPADIIRPPQARETISPDPHLGPAFAAAYDRFRAAYPALKALG